MSRRRQQLERRLGLIDTTAVALGAIIGAGIFVVLGEAAGVTAGGLPLAILAAALVATLNGLSSVQLGVNYPQVGGAYEFGYRLLHPVIGFGAGWLFLLAGVAASTTYTLTFAGYLEPVVPGVPLRAIAVGLALLALGVNIAGAHLSQSANNLLVAFKVAVLVILVGIGGATLAAGRTSPPAPVDIAGLPRAVALLFFAFTGYARPVTIAGEVRDPARTLPRAVIYALASATVLYLAVSLIALGLVGPSVLATSPDPLRQALIPTGQAWAGSLVAVGALVATFTVLLTEIWGLSRLVFAMSRRGDLPQPLGRLSGGGVPRLAVLAVGSIIVVLTAAMDLSPALSASSLALLLYYAVMNAASLRLRPEQRLYPLAVPYAGLAISVALAFALPAEAAIAVIGALAAGLAYYAWRHR